MNNEHELERLRNQVDQLRSELEDVREQSAVDRAWLDLYREKGLKTAWNEGFYAGYRRGIDIAYEAATGDKVSRDPSVFNNPYEREDTSD